MAAVKLSERERRLLTVTAGFTVFYLFYQVFLIPKWTEVVKLKEKARVQRQELRVAEGKVKVLAAMGQSAAIFSGPAPTSREERALEILKTLSQATAQSGLDLNSIRPIAEASGEELRFSLSGNGKYRNLYDFLALLRNSRMLVLIDRLNISAGEGALLTVEMALTVY